MRQRQRRRRAVAIFGQQARNIREGGSYHERGVECSLCGSPYDLVVATPEGTAYLCRNGCSTDRWSHELIVTHLARGEKSEHTGELMHPSLLLAGRPSVKVAEGRWRS